MLSTINLGTMVFVKAVPLGIGVTGSFE